MREVARRAGDDWAADAELVDADVFIPNGGVGGDVGLQKFAAFGGVEIDDSDAVRSEFVYAAMEGLRFADDDGAEAELADETGAIKARGKRGDHDKVAISFLPPSAAKGVGLCVKRRVSLLHAAIVAGADQSSISTKDCRAYRDAAFGDAGAGFSECNGEHGSVVWHGAHH